MCEFLGFLAPETDEHDEVPLTKTNCQSQRKFYTYTLPFQDGRTCNTLCERLNVDEVKEKV